MFEHTEPAARIALQRELDMDVMVSAMPDFEATRLGTLGPLTTGQAILNKKRAGYIQQVIDDFGPRAEVFVLFAFRGYTTMTPTRSSPSSPTGATCISFLRCPRLPGRCRRAA